MPITIELRIDDHGAVIGTRQIKQELDGLDKTAARTGKSVSGVNDVLMNQAKSILPALTAGWVAYKALGIAKEVMSLSSRYETLGVVMKTVGANAGYNNAQMQVFQKGLEKTGISMISSRQTLTQMVQAQLDLAKSSELARVAQDAAVIGNMNSSEAFERLIYGIQSGQVEMLRTIGINVNFENSYQKVAKATGRASTSFTEAEKAAIRMNTVIEAGARISGTYESAMETAGKQALSLERHLENLKVLVGSDFLTEFALSITLLTKAIESENKALEDNMKNRNDFEEYRKLTGKEGGLTTYEMTAGMNKILTPEQTSWLEGPEAARLRDAMEKLNVEFETGLKKIAGEGVDIPLKMTIPGKEKDLEAIKKAAEERLKLIRDTFKETKYLSEFMSKEGGYGRIQIPVPTLGRFGEGIEGLDASRKGEGIDMAGMRLGRFGNVPTEYTKLTKEENDKLIGLQRTLQDQRIMMANDQSAEEIEILKEEFETKYGMYDENNVVRIAAEKVLQNDIALIHKDAMDGMNKRVFSMGDIWGSTMDQMVIDTRSAFEEIGNITDRFGVKYGLFDVIETHYKKKGNTNVVNAMESLKDFGNMILPGRSFQEGGYTGSTGGRVHGGEYVMPKPVVDQYGPGFFDRLISAMKESGSGDHRTIYINQSFTAQERREMMSLDDDKFADRVLRVINLRKV